MRVSGTSHESLLTLFCLPGVENCHSAVDQEELADISPVILGYFTSWSIYARQYFVGHILADKMTHISYAFAKIDSDGRVTVGDSYADILIQLPDDQVNQSLYGNFNQFLKLKKKYPHLRTLISVGGDVRTTSHSHRQGPSNQLSLCRPTSRNSKRLSGRTRVERSSLDRA